MKRKLSLLMALVLGISMTACSKPAGQQTSAGDSGQAQTTQAYTAGDEKKDSEADGTTAQAQGEQEQGDPYKVGVFLRFSDEAGTKMQATNTSITQEYGNPWFFRNSVTDAYHSYTLCDYIVNDMGAKKLLSCMRRLPLGWDSMRILSAG